MPPKRARIDNGEDSEMAQSIKLMKEEILEKFDVHKKEMSQQFNERVDKLEEQLQKANEKQPLEKEFVLKHTFKNISGMEPGSKGFSELEEHYGQRWYILLHCKNEHLGVYLVVRKPKGDFLIETETEFVISVENDTFRSIKQIGKICKESGEQGEENNAFGLPNFISLEDLKAQKGNKLDVQIRVKVLKMVGFVRPKAFDFGEANKEHSDVVLNTGNEKFYLQRGYLAHHSDYFRRFFSKNFKEGQSGLQEFPLSNTDAQDFQNFLEVLYGNAKVDEFTVENILLLIDFYNSAYVREKCEKFLMKKSAKPLRKKLELASRFQLNALADDCFSKISRDEYKALAEDGFLDGASYYVLRAFSKKSADFL